MGKHFKFVSAKPDSPMFKRGWTVGSGLASKEFSKHGRSQGSQESSTTGQPKADPPENPADGKRHE